MSMITSRQNQRVKDIRRLRRSKGDHALLEGPHLVAEALAAGLRSGGDPGDAAPSWPPPRGGGSRRLSPSAPLEVEPGAAGRPDRRRLPPGRPRRGPPPPLRGRGPAGPPGPPLSLSGRPPGPRQPRGPRPGGRGRGRRRASPSPRAASTPTTPAPCAPRPAASCASPSPWPPSRTPSSPTSPPPSRAGPPSSPGTARTSTGADLAGTLVLAVGAEGPGLSPALLARAGLRLTIPMEPAVESLNATVAAALVLFEVRRRRRA